MSEPVSAGGESPPALERAARAVAILGGLVSLATAIVVVVSVLLRWSGVGSVPGDFELVQMGTAIAVFSFLPLCQLHRGNIMVDTFTSRLPERATRAIDALWDFVYAAMMLILAFSLAQGARDVIRNGTNTMVLALPLWPAIAIAAALVFVLVVVTVAGALRLIRLPS